MLTWTKFLDIPIGHLFWAHNTVWTRTSYEAGTCISPGRYGSCNFIDDPSDEHVLAIDGKEIERLAAATYNLGGHKSKR